MKQNIFLGGFLCLIASMSWGAMFPVANHAFQYIDPLHFTIIRYIPVIIILSILLYFIEGKQAFRSDGNGRSVWFFGVMGFTIYNLLIFFGQDLMGDSGILAASIMEALAPMISVLFLWAVYRQKPNRFTFICIIIAFIGAFTVVTNGNLGVLFSRDNQLIPLLLLFFAAGGWAIYTIGGGRFSGWSVLRFSTLSCLYGTVTATVIVAIVTAAGYIELPTLSALHSVRYDMLFMIIFPGLFALLGWNKGVSILKPVNAILFINFVPVTTVAIRMFQGHVPTTFEVVGVLLICVTLIASNIHQRMNIKRQQETKVFERQLAS